MGYPHHVTQQGNYRQVVFSHADDYARYLRWLAQYAAKYGFKIWAYCLMPNHVHFVGVPEAQDTLARTFNAAHMHYSQYYNRKRGTNGHLWQGRFFSCVLDDHHARAAVRYVELNPVRTGSVSRAEDYPWSSARSHVSKTPDAVLADRCSVTETIKDWRRFLACDPDPEAQQAIVKATISGRPCGVEAFVAQMECLLNRSFSRLPTGRPRGSKAKSGSAPPLLQP